MRLDGGGEMVEEVECQGWLTVEVLGRGIQ